RRKRLVSGRCPPAMLIGSLLGVGKAFNRLLPGARGNAVVCPRQIRLGDLQVEDGLAFGVVPSLDDLPGFVLVGGAEAGAFAGGGVHAIELVSPDAPAS